MELSIYDIIKKVVTTPKSIELRRKFGKITFVVNKSANKIVIREAVEKIWNVKVRDVRIMVTPGKQRTVARKTYQLPDGKKAIITLRPGYRIDLPDQMETMGLSGVDKAATSREGEK